MRRLRATTKQTNVFPAALKVNITANSVNCRMSSHLVSLDSASLVGLVARFGMWVVLFITSDVDGQSCYAVASGMINVIMIPSSMDQTLLSLPAYS